MSVAVTKPYACPNGSTVTTVGWWLLGDQLDPLPERLPGWDYNTDISIMCELEIDVRSFFAQANLDEDATVAAALTWKCPTTVVKGSGDAKQFSLANPATTLQLVAHIPGRTIGGTVELACAVLLGTPSANPAPVAARRPGSLLWENARELHVEGSAARFPIQLIDFASAGLPPSGYWHLSWNPFDLDLPFLSNVCLYLNAGRAEIVRLSGMSTNTTFYAMLTFDVARQLLQNALRNDEFLANSHSYAVGSTGAAIHKLTLRVQGGSNVRELARLMTERPEYFETLLQSKLNFLNERTVPAT